MSENSGIVSGKNIRGSFPLTVEMNNKVIASNLSIYH